MTEVIVSVFFADDKIISAHCAKQDVSSTKFEATNDAIDSETNSTGNGRQDLKIAAEYVADLSIKLKVPIAGVCLICPTPHTYQRTDSDKEIVQIGLSNVAGWRNVRPEQMFREALDSVQVGGALSLVPITVIDSRTATAFGDRNRRIDSEATQSQTGKLSIESRYLYFGNDTSIGAAFIDNTNLGLHGRATPEVGHFVLSRHPKDVLPCACQFHPHRNCAEGLASLTAIKRWDYTLEQFIALPATHEKVQIIAYYMAQILANLTLTLSPEIIVIGGRVLLIPDFVQHVRGYYDEFLNVKHSDEGVVHFPDYSEQKNTVQLIRTQKHIHCGVEGGLYCINRSLSKRSSVATN
jgi:hypothetical protein